MAKLISITVALVCILSYSFLCNGKEGDDFLTAGEWNDWFLRLFGNQPDKSNGPRWILNLMRLQENTPEVDQIRREIVDFWYDAVIDDLKHCNSQYLSRMKDERQKYLDKGYKKDVIYEFVQKKVTANCMKRLSDSLKETVEDWITMEDKNAIFQLGDYWSSKQSKGLLLDRNRLNREIVRYIRSKVPTVALGSKEEFAVAWRAGICDRFLAQLDDNVMNITQYIVSLDNFHVHYDRYDEAPKWARGVEACKYFVTDEALDELWEYLPHGVDQVAA